MNNAQTLKIRTMTQSKTRCIKHILFLLIAVLIAGCKKDKCHPLPFPPSSNLIKTEKITSSYPSFTTYNNTYTYDSQGRLLQVTRADLTVKYVYMPGTITVSSYGPVDTVLLSSTYYLNTQGLVFSQFRGDTIYYDNAGEAVLEIRPGYTVKRVWRNGDEISDTTYSSTTGMTIDTLVYLSTIDNRNFGQPYFGKTPTHLLNFGNYSYDPSCHDCFPFNPTYTFDNRGRVSTKTSPYGPISGSSIEQYTYY